MWLDVAAALGRKKKKESIFLPTNCTTTTKVSHRTFTAYASCKPHAHDRWIGSRAGMLSVSLAVRRPAAPAPQHCERCRGWAPRPRTVRLVGRAHGSRGSFHGSALPLGSARSHASLAERIAPPSPSGPPPPCCWRSFAHSLTASLLTQIVAYYGGGVRRPGRAAREGGGVWEASGRRSESPA